VISEAHGIPLAVSLTGGNRNDVTQLMPLIAAIPPVRGRRGRPRQRPDQVYADRGYDHDKYRRQVRTKGITPVIARRSTVHGSGLGTYRGVIEQSIALLHSLVPAAADPLGNPRRHPRGLSQPRLRHHLLAQTTESVTLLGPLSPARDPSAAEDPHQPAPGLWRSDRNSPAQPGKRWPFGRSGRHHALQPFADRHQFITIMHHLDRWRVVAAGRSYRPVLREIY
jgi:hypothetical protein